MGLIANIYKNNGQDFSNGGLSSRVNEVTVVNVDGPFEPTEDRPAVLLVEGNARGTVKVVPALEGGDGWTAWPGSMMGGCYVATSDARFTQAVEDLLGISFYGAIALHDRYE
jgi:hypothetical protein